MNAFVDLTIETIDVSYVQASANMCLPTLPCNNVEIIQSERCHNVNRTLQIGKVRRAAAQAQCVGQGGGIVDAEPASDYGPYSLGG